MQKNKKNLSTNDKLIRAALLSNVKATQNSVIEEFTINKGSARIDVAVLDDFMHGYEIKSDRDSLLRLPKQIEAYNAVFANITIVTGYHHIETVIDIVPEWWGVMLAKIDDSDQIVLSEIRTCLPNVTQDPIAIAKLLWRDEALSILEAMNQAKGLRSKSTSAIYQKLGSLLDCSTLQEIVRQKISLRSPYLVV